MCPLLCLLLALIATLLDRASGVVPPYCDDAIIESLHQCYKSPPCQLATPDIYGFAAITTGYSPKEVECAILEMTQHNDCNITLYPFPEENQCPYNEFFKREEEYDEPDHIVQTDINGITYRIYFLTNNACAGVFSVYKCVDRCSCSHIKEDSDLRPLGITFVTLKERTEEEIKATECALEEARSCFHKLRIQVNDLEPCTPYQSEECYQ